MIENKNMIVTYNKLPFAELIYSNRINPLLKGILNKTNRLLSKREINNLCMIYQTTEDLNSVNSNIEKLNKNWQKAGISWD